MEEELKIKKIGYRVRILNKLKAGKFSLTQILNFTLTNVKAMNFICMTKRMQ